MFRQINKHLTKKTKLFQKKEDKENEVNKQLQSFLKEEYGQDFMKIAKYAVVYQPQKQVLIIETPAKILANDLILKKNKLECFLNKKTKIKQIIIK